MGAVQTAAGGVTPPPSTSGGGVPAFAPGGAVRARSPAVGSSGQRHRHRRRHPATCSRSSRIRNRRPARRRARGRGQLRGRSFPLDRSLAATPGVRSPAEASKAPRRTSTQMDRGTSTAAPPTCAWPGGGQIRCLDGSSMRVAPWPCNLTGLPGPSPPPENAPTPRAVAPRDISGMAGVARPLPCIPLDAAPLAASTAPFRRASAAAVQSHPAEAAVVARASASARP